MDASRQPPRPAVNDPDDLTAFDVVVVGAGLAGTVAAIEAAGRGARVVVLDRWGRGGASARSGGIIYAGGGTAQQARAGFDDDPSKMAQYLELEGGARVDIEVLDAFCGQSRENLAWLEELGVEVPLGFDPEKSVTPTDDAVGLYFSGNEKHFAEIHGCRPPRPPGGRRGHDRPRPHDQPPPGSPVTGAWSSATGFGSPAWSPTIESGSPASTSWSSTPGPSPASATTCSTGWWTPPRPWPTGSPACSTTRWTDGAKPRAAAAHRRAERR